MKNRTEAFTSDTTPYLGTFASTVTVDTANTGLAPTQTQGLNVLVLYCLRSSITLSPSPAFVHLLCALFQWTERTGRRILRADVSVTATDDDRKMSTEVETQINEDGEGRWKESAAASLVDTTDLEYTAIGAMREAGGGGEEEAIEMGDIQTRPAETSAVVVMLLPSDEGRHFDNDKERRARCLCGCFKTCRCLRKSRLMRICRLVLNDREEVAKQ